MKYVCSGATLKCTMGTSCSILKATPKNVSLTGKDQANIADFVSMANIFGFGNCRSLAYPPTASATAANHGKLTPMPCVPGTCSKWTAIDKDSLVCGESALLEAATLRCVHGGTISIVEPGQALEIKINIPIINNLRENDNADENVDNEVSEEKGLTFSNVVDGIQLTLDLLGLIPGVGAIPDLVNAAIYALRGKWLEAGLSIIAAVPGVGDVATGTKIARRGVTRAARIKKVEAIKSAIKNNDAAYFVDKDISRRQLQKNGMSSRDADKFLNDIKTKRTETATEFLKSQGEKNIEGHIKGIDLSKPVIVKEIPPDDKPMKLYRYIRRGKNGAVEYGQFFTDTPKNLPYDVGISGTYGKGRNILEEHNVYYTDFKNKKVNKVVSSKVVEEDLYEMELVEFTVNPTNKVKCLQSTAAPIKAPKNADWSDKAVENMIETKGGGTQYYIPMNNAERRKVSKTAKKVNESSKNTVFEQPAPKDTLTRTVTETYDFTKK